MRDLPALRVLGRVWLQNYQQTDKGLEWREADNIPPAFCFVRSLHDTDAHLAKKGSTCWGGYKVHLTETCDEQTPPLITHVETTAASIADGEATPRVHQALRDKALLPKTHIVDTGYLDAALLVSTQQEYGLELLGPTRPDIRWQARQAEGFASENFTIDWDKQQALCPQGHTSRSWSPQRDKRGNDVIQIKFSCTHCRACPERTSCVASTKKYVRRMLTIPPRNSTRPCRRPERFNPRKNMSGSTFAAPVSRERSRAVCGHARYGAPATSDKPKYIWAICWQRRR